MKINTLKDRENNILKNIYYYIFFAIFINIELLPLFCFASGNSIAALEQEQRFYEDSKQGWFWYHDPVPEKDEEKDKGEKKKKAVASVKVDRSVNLDNYTVEELWNMYPDDFQNLSKTILKKAVQYPTEENILQYLTMQDIARRKASAYSRAAAYVTQKYPNIFSVNSVYPVTTPGVNAKVLTQKREIATTINNAGRNHALIFFVQPGCGFCEKQTAILKFFQDKYGWPIKTVDIRRNSTAAARFNVKITPTLLLIEKGRDKYMTVATGVVALSTLEKNLYGAIRILDGRTDQNNYMLYDYEKGSPLDPKSILQHPKPWAKR